MILCSGCSFTIGPHKDKDWNDVDYKHWPEFLISQTKNVALGGAGNRRIARTVLENLDDDIKAVVVMWSTPERYDYYMPQYNAYKLEGASYTGTKQEYLKYFYTDFNMFAKTLEYYILIQNTLKAKNIPYIPMHMGDPRYKDWDQDKAYGVDVNENGSMRVLTQEEKDSVKVETFLEKAEHHWEEKKVINKLWNEVDWDQWVFHKEYGGLWQFTNDGNYKWIAYHPPEQAHKDWAEQYINPRLKQLGIA